MARHKKHRPTDPAEAARQRREREAQTRRTPGEWGPNEAAIASQADVASIPADRGKTRRIYRFDCFATLQLPNPDYLAVRRLETLLSVRFRTDGKEQGAKVDGGGSAELVTARSMAAGDEIDAITGWADLHDAKLILALLTPQATEGSRVNWHATVKAMRGLTDRGEQSKAVKKAAASLVTPFARWDAGERPAKMRVAA